MCELWCDTCEAGTLFETPPCADGHGVDCDEMVCTVCGAAVFVEPMSWRLPR